MPEPTTTERAPELEPVRLPCSAPVDIRAEIARYDATATTGLWEGLRYRVRYRVRGDGPPLILVPGIASTYRVYTLLLNQFAASFQTIVYDYPGEHPDGAHLARISHDDLVDDLFGLIDHLNLRQLYLLGISFGSTVVLKALLRAGALFPRSAIQGGFGRRQFTVAERCALWLGQLLPGTAARLPLRRRVLAYNCKSEFASIIEDRFQFYLDQNALTPIRSLAHRTRMLANLDLRPILRRISSKILLIQGNEDRIIPKAHFDELTRSLPCSKGVVIPTAGHQLHLTHAEVMAELVREWFMAREPSAEKTRDRA
jgi:pimeloyl-ACP methyl ester carboxylesterase